MMKNRSISTFYYKSVLFVLSFFLMFIIGALTIWDINRIRDEKRIRIKHALNTFVDRFDANIDFIDQLTKKVAQSHLSINGIINENNGREYFNYALQDLVFHKGVIKAAVLDYSGHLIIEKPHSSKASYSNIINKSLATGSNSKTVVNNKMYITEPISYYNTTQGVIVVTIDLQEIFDISSDNLGFFYALTSSQGLLLTNTGNELTSNDSFDIYLNGFPYDSSQNVRLQEIDRNDITTLYSSLLVLSIAGCIGAIGIVGLSRLIGKKLSTPIDEVTEQIEAGKSLITIDGAYDELYLLVDALNSRHQESEAAKSLAEERANFLARVSHELRTPLTAIKGFSEQARFNLGKKPQDVSKTLDSLDVVDTNTNFLVNLINDLLDASKLEQGFMPLDVKPLDVVEMIQGVVNIFKQSAAEKDNVLSFDYNSDDICIMGDILRIKQVVVNIVSNAMKFTSHGRVDIQLLKLDSGISISIKDDGVGIKKVDMPSIFNAFSQAFNPALPNHNGTGLGLYICKKIINQMGGDISAESVIGQGAEFTIRIPVEFVAKDKIKQINNKEMFILDNIPKLTSTIVVVDDVTDMLNLYKVIFAECGIKLYTFTSGNELVDAVDTIDFDLMILDMQMPGLSGTETLAQLRNKGLNQPAIISTASLMPHEKAHYYASGFCDCLDKPISRHKLFQMLMKYLKEEDADADVDASPPETLEDKMAALKRQYIEDFVEKLDVIEAALHESDLESVRKEAHKIKGSAGSHGYSKLSAISKALESYAKANDQKNATIEFAKLKIEYDKNSQSGTTKS